MSVAQNVSIVTPLFESFSILTTIVCHIKFSEKSTGSEKFGLWNSAEVVTAKMTRICKSTDSNSYNNQKTVEYVREHIMTTFKSPLKRKLTKKVMNIWQKSLPKTSCFFLLFYSLKVWLNQESWTTWQTVWIEDEDVSKRDTVKRLNEIDWLSTSASVLSVSYRQNFTWFEKDANMVGFKH